MATIATPQLLTVLEATRRLNVSRWTVYRYVEEGLSAVRLGAGGASGPLRIPADGLDAWIEKRRTHS